MEIILRPETPQDYPAIRQLVSRAFAHAPHSDGDEQNLVERLRQTNVALPEACLVAEINGKIVGHIMFSKVTVAYLKACGLAPLAVEPTYQNLGIGGQLITRGHQILKAQGFTCSIVLGHAAYYPKFGYQKALAYNITSPFPVPNENFMVKAFQPFTLTEATMVKYPAAFT